MFGHSQIDLAKLRAVPSVRPMEESGDGDAQTSPGYDQGRSPSRRQGFVERRRHPRRGPWTADAVTVASQAQSHMRIRLVSEPAAPAANWAPVAISMAAGQAARGGTRGRSTPGMLNLPMSGTIRAARRA